MKTQLALLALPLLASAALADEIAYCRGRWTNLPCNGAPQATVGPENSARHASTESFKDVPDADRRERRRLFSRLEMKNNDARRRYDVSLDLGPAKRYCFEEQSSLTDCERRLEEVDDRIERRIVDAKMLLAHEKEREDAAREERKRQRLREEADRKDREQASVNQQSNAVTVIQETETFYRGDGRRRRWHDHNGRYHDRYHRGAGVHIGSGRIQPQLPPAAPVNPTPQTPGPTSPPGRAPSGFIGSVHGNR